MSLEGQLVWRTEEVYIDVNFDRIALAGNTIAVLSAVGPLPQVKALRACFGVPLKSALELIGPGGPLARAVRDAAPAIVGALPARAVDPGAQAPQLQVRRLRRVGPVSSHQGSR